MDLRIDELEIKNNSAIMDALFYSFFHSNNYLCFLVLPFLHLNQHMGMRSYMQTCVALNFPLATCFTAMSFPSHDY